MPKWAVQLSSLLLLGLFFLLVSQVAKALEDALVLDKVWDEPTWDGTMTKTCKRMAGWLERAMAAHGAFRFAFI